jgi:hypothetical protein
MTLDGIAVRLNAEGHTSRRGRPWNPVQVLRVLERVRGQTVDSRGLQQGDFTCGVAHYKAGEQKHRKGKG